MADWHSGVLQANHIHIHYTRTGGAKPPVVLAHGFTDDGLCWTRVARALEADYDVIMPDARGHGRSDAPASGYGPDEMADDLAGLIRGLGLTSPIVLGHSMGAMTSLFLASRYPGLPRAIALEDPPARWDSEFLADDAAGRARERTWIEGLQRQSREALIAAERENNPLWDAQELGPWADSKLRFNPNFLNREPPGPADWAALFSHITCPVLLITADPAKGAIVSGRAAASLAAMLPQTKRARIAGAGHSIHRDQFAAYMEVVRTQFAEWGQARSS